MESARIYAVRNKPRAVFMNTFGFEKELKLGDKGQMKVLLEVENERLQMDEEGNERKYMMFKINKAELVGFQEARIK